MLSLFAAGRYRKKKLFLSFFDGAGGGLRAVGGRELFFCDATLFHRAFFLNRSFDFFAAALMSRFLVATVVIGNLTGAICRLRR